MYLEELAKAVLGYLQSSLADNLDAVETYWDAEGDALMLPDVKTWELGGDPDILDYDRDSLPVVVSMAQMEGPSGEHMTGGVTMADQSDQWGYGLGNALASVLWWVAADDAETAVKYGWRYAKAIVMTLRDHERLGDGIRIGNYVPKVQVDPPRVEYPDTGGPYYTVMGQIEFGVEIVHS